MTLVTVTSSAGPATVMTGQASTSPVFSTVNTAQASDAPKTRGRKGNQLCWVSSWSTSTGELRGVLPVGPGGPEQQGALVDPAVDLRPLVQARLVDAAQAPPRPCPLHHRQRPLTHRGVEDAAPSAAARPARRGARGWPRGPPPVAPCGPSPGSGCRGAAGVGMVVTPMGGMKRPTVPIRVRNRTTSPAGLRYSRVSHSAAGSHSDGRDRGVGHLQLGVGHLHRPGEGEGGDFHLRPGDAGLGGDRGVRDLHLHPGDVGLAARVGTSGTSICGQAIRAWATSETASRTISPLGEPAPTVDRRGGVHRVRPVGGEPVGGGGTGPLVQFRARVGGERRAAGVGDDRPEHGPGARRQGGGDGGGPRNEIGLHHRGTRRCGPGSAPPPTSSTRTAPVDENPRSWLVPAS